MTTDTLVLGGIAFDDWSTPDRMPFGGKQELKVHQLPGGARVVDTLGPSEMDIHFTGTMYANNAYGVADQLDAMRIAGNQVPLSADDCRSCGSGGFPAAHPGGRVFKAWQKYAAGRLALFDRPSAT
jgi:hypothetical protein